MGMLYSLVIEPSISYRSIATNSMLCLFNWEGVISLTCCDYGSLICRIDQVHNIGQGEMLVALSISCYELLLVYAVYVYIHKFF